MEKVINMTSSLEKINLILELEKNANLSTITGIAILSAIRGGKFSTDEILRYVQEQATDSFKTMSNCIGEELTNKILNYKP